MKTQGETVWFQLSKMRPSIESIAKSLAKLVELLEAEQRASNQTEPERLEAPTGSRVEQNQETE